jgi:hypothetical protein
MKRVLIHELATARFIQQREDALFLGPPGTGKSHLSQAIGRAAIRQGYRVVYREAHRSTHLASAPWTRQSRGFLGHHECQFHRVQQERQACIFRLGGTEQQ